MMLYIITFASVAITSNGRSLHHKMVTPKGVENESPSIIYAQELLDGERLGEIHRLKLSNLTNDTDLTTNNIDYCLYSSHKRDYFFYLRRIGDRKRDVKPIRTIQAAMGRTRKHLKFLEAIHADRNNPPTLPTLNGGITEKTEHGFKITIPNASADLPPTTWIIMSEHGVLERGLKEDVELEYHLAAPTALKEVVRRKETGKLEEVITYQRRFATSKNCKQLVPQDGDFYNREPTKNRFCTQNSFYNDIPASLLCKADSWPQPHKLYLNSVMAPSGANNKEWRNQDNIDNMVHSEYRGVKNARVYRYVDRAEKRISVEIVVGDEIIKCLMFNYHDDKLIGEWFCGRTDHYTIYYPMRNILDKTRNMMYLRFSKNAFEGTRVEFNSDAKEQFKAWCKYPEAVVKVFNEGELTSRDLLTRIYADPKFIPCTKEAREEALREDLSTTSLDEISQIISKTEDLYSRIDFDELSPIHDEKQSDSEENVSGPSPVGDSGSAVHVEAKDDHSGASNDTDKVDATNAAAEKTIKDHASNATAATTRSSSAISDIAAGLNLTFEDGDKTFPEIKKALSNSFDTMHTRNIGMSNIMEDLPSFPRDPDSDEKGTNE